MNGLPTASQLNLTMLCVGSCVLPRCNSVQEAADEGTALHEYLARCASGTADALSLVPPQWRERAASIDLERVPTWAPHEVSYAVSLDGTRARLLRSRSEYTTDEWCGTADVFAPGVVGEYKTGRVPVPLPARNWQIKLAALANSLLHSTDEVQASLYTIGQSGYVDDKTVPLDDFDHLHTAAGLAALHRRICHARLAVAACKVPALVTGEHCRYCPSLRLCPAQTAIVRRTLRTWEDRDPAALDLRQLDDAEIAAAYAHAKTLKGYVQALERAIHAHAAQTPIILDERHALGEVETEGPERIISAEATANAVTAELGPEAVATAVPTEPKCTKTAIKEACRQFAPKGKAAATERAILERLRDAGAMERHVTRKITVYER